MSEGSKMGLFGSKDKNQEQKEKSSKDNSPVRYAPYCIDSDTETYDTEALSMMDINDIIGVQSEQTGDSTLESEIAALSQIITESKVESTQRSMDAKLEVQQGLSQISSSTFDTASLSNIHNIADEQSSSILEKCVTSSLEMQEDMTSQNNENVTCGEKKLESNVTECNKPSDPSIEIVGDTLAVSTSSNNNPHVEADSPTIKLAFQEITQSKRQTDSTYPLIYEEKIGNKSTQNTNKAKDRMSKHTVDTSVVTVGSISKSLQLIGEAYISEDSEETNIDDTDNPDETSSSLIGKTSLLSISTIQQGKDNSNTDKVDVPEQNIPKLLELTNASPNDPERLNIEVTNVTNSRTEDPIQNIKIEGTKDSNQPEILQQTEIQQCIENSDNVPICTNNEISINIHKQKSENNIEIDKIDIVEETSLEALSENSIEPADKLVNTSTMLPNETTKSIEESQKIKTEDNKSELNKSAVAPETEEQDSSMLSNKSEVLNTEKLINESNTKDISKCKNENISLESTNETLVLTETFDKELNITETNEKDSLQHTAVIKSSQSIQETVVRMVKINDDSQEIAERPMNIEMITMASGIQDNVNLSSNAEDTSLLIDKSSCKAVSSTVNDILDLNKDTVSLIHLDITETKTNTITDLSINDNTLNEENIAPGSCLTNLITQQDTNPVHDINNSEKTVICIEEDTCAESFEPLIPVEHVQSIKHLPSILEKSENDKSSNIVSDLHSAIISNEESNSAVETKNAKTLLENQKAVKENNIQILETVSLISHEDENEALPIENTPKEELDQSRVDTRDEFTPLNMQDTSTSRNVAVINTLSGIDVPLTDNSVIQENVRNILYDTNSEKNKAKDSIVSKITPSKMEIRENQMFTSSTSKEKITKSEEQTEEKNPEKYLVSGLKTASDAQVTKDNKNTQDEKIYSEASGVCEKELIEIIDDNIMSITEEKSAERMISESTNDDLKNPQSSDISILQENLEVINNEENKDTGSKDKNILYDMNDTVKLSSQKQYAVATSLRNTTDVINTLNDNNANNTNNILAVEINIENKAIVQQNSADIPLEVNIDKLAEKLSENSGNIDDTIANQNVDSLEGLLGLELISGNENTSLKNSKTETSKMQIEETIKKDIDTDLLLNQANRDQIIMIPNSDYLTNVIADCLTNRDDEAGETDISVNSKIIGTEDIDPLKITEDMNRKPVEDKINDENINESPGRNRITLQQDNLGIDFVSEQLESVEDLEESEPKMDLRQDLLLQDVVARENLDNTPTGIEHSQSSSEISELESAVKFLQESEEQTIDSPLVLSPKMVESVVEDITKQADAELYASHEADNYANASELVADLRHVATDPISISEAEIITEAAKLENERKFAAQMQNDPTYHVEEKNNEEINTKIEQEQIQTSSKISKNISDAASIIDNSTNIQAIEKLHIQKEESTPDIRPLSSEGILKACELISRSSILEERLKEPPKIEIPLPDSGKICESSISPNNSLLIPKDAKAVMYSRMLESPKSIDKAESSKVIETPRKDSDRHDFENVGSPRIILKITKSAIADCSEPRSPKSPKIRSAANSPNPEDSPSQKLGKIKLKLSKGGHPSIISNENLDEANQWYTDSTSSSSLIGMKIKLSKSGDASIVSADKHENLDDLKETKYKFEEPKRTNSPIGMKIKLSKSGDASIVQQDSKEILAKHKEKLEIPQGSPKRTESPIGMKIKLSKTGDASIIQTDRQEFLEECKETAPKRTDSPIGMKIKLSKSRDTAIVSPDIPDDVKDFPKVKEKQETYPELPKRTESPIGMKIKLSKSKGSASIISVDNTEDMRDKLEVPDPPKRTESPLGMKIKLSKSGDASIIHSEITDDAKEVRYKEKSEIAQDIVKPLESGIKIKLLKPGDTSTLSGGIEEQYLFQGPESSVSMRIKVSKSGDASDKTEPVEDLRLREAQLEAPKRTESPIGMKIKLSKSGDASIVQSETTEDYQKTTHVSDAEYSKADSSLGMKIKLFKTGDASVVETEKKDKQQKRRDTESPLEMKIKLSKTGHPTIVTCDNHGELAHKAKDPLESALNLSNRYKDFAITHKEPTLKILKTGSSTILQSNRSELTIEPVQMQSRKMDNVMEISPKRKEITISPIECKKSKLEAQLSQILPEVTIQPVMCRDQKQLLFDPKTSLISRQQMNVISQEISITQVRPTKTTDASIGGKLKDILCKNSPGGSDCEIIEHRPELIIVNENSNSSQDVVIIEEVPNRMAEIKVPKKRGRPRRNPLAQQLLHPPLLVPRDTLALNEMQQVPQFEHRENERPKRTCRSQKSYAPPKRGRGRGRGKRRLDNLDIQIGKKPRVDQDLSAIEASTMAIITIDKTTVRSEDSLRKSSELYKALKQPPVDRKNMSSVCKAEKHSILINRKEIGKKDFAKASDALAMQLDSTRSACIQEDPSKMCLTQTSTNSTLLDSKDADQHKQSSIEMISEQTQKMAIKQYVENKGVSKILDGSRSNTSEIKEIPVPPGHSNWLTPTSKKQAEVPIRGETVSTVQVIDEETRMSAESGSRSQTPARNIPAPASETIINEESQGSVLSTATTESEKVKVKNRRMEINFDPDEGPFTVDKIAEYEWPLDRKGETFMIQEQISQYLGVKSFKRKYPDLKRRMVDMEERNYLRENGLVSEAMCDMGLTAVCSSEVLDVMCSDFPDQYEEYRKHMREKQVKEHSKKQKELTAAANAERNRIDLAEMAVQSALSWNINLNKARRESRKCCLDLQTFTIHIPKKQQKVDIEHKMSHYPVALIPGQYTDYYREYTSAELRYYPLNTVLYGPMRPNERKFDSQSEGSQSDSDSESSSDDSSSSSSEGTQDTEGSQSTMDDVDMEIVTQKDDIKLKCKMCLKVLNKHNKNEILIQCGTCNGNVHPSCIDLTLDMVPHIQSYSWQCTDCKTCAQCHDPADEDKMLFCDMCDRGYHIYCVGLRRVPQGRWHCQECAVCANCSSREPGGANSDRNSVAQWQHEYKKGEKNTRVYVSTFCIPCSKLWRKGRYCPHCSRCHTAQRLDLEPNLVHCSACDKYLHLDCVETKGIMVDKRNYLCEFCAPSNRQQMLKPLLSRMLKT